MDPRFCDVRSWVAYAGDSEQRHWEAVGIVDVETMWCALGVDLGDPNSVARKPFVPAKDSRAKRKHRKKCCHKSSAVSANEFQSRMHAL